MPEIIRFSNDLCYSDTPLIPLRQYGPNRPAARACLLSGGYREFKQPGNQPTRAKPLSKGSRKCGDSRYDGKTISGGASGERKRLIENQLLERLGAEWNAAAWCAAILQFQGDERDILFLSLVALATKNWSLTKAADRRFNVAASRARDMMILSILSLVTISAYPVFGDNCSISSRIQSPNRLSVSNE